MMTEARELSVLVIEAGELSVLVIEAGELFMVAGAAFLVSNVWMYPSAVQRSSLDH